MLKDVLENAVDLHSGKLPPEEAKKVEISREKLAFSKVSRVCLYANEYLEYCKLKRGPQMWYEEEKGYSPERYLIGVLSDIYIRSMAGHGSEAKAVSILLGEDVILDQTFVRTGDRFGSTFDTNPKKVKVEKEDGGIRVTFENFPFSPKSPEHSSETSGYYKVEILISNNAERNDQVRSMADAKLEDLDKIYSTT